MAAQIPEVAEEVEAAMILQLLMAECVAAEVGEYITGLPAGEGEVGVSLFGISVMIKFKLIFPALVMLILVTGFYNAWQPEPASAGSGHNLSGWAWSETIGWISFNSTNQNTATNYGVKVAANGDISGYAWAEHIGWISFNETAGCPTAPCAPKFNKATGAVSGWAKALAGGTVGSGGWDGWIHLRGSNYGVTASGCNWDGYAWGSDIVGWIHFKGTNYEVVGSGEACSNSSPSATNLSVSQPDYCVSGPAGVFSWTFQDPGDTQSAYQVQVDNSSNFSSPED
ncbi:MAG: hypothetical protein AAB538_01080, partial [Patescibacteria group bacterium]